MGLKRHLPEIRFEGLKVSPDEIDQNRQYVVLYPTISDTYLGTVTTSSSAAVVFTNTAFDYPRNVLFTILGAASGQGGTLVVNGKNQFGDTQSETIGFATANGGGTAAGTKIFATVTSGTVTAGAASGTAKVGAAKGTAAGIINLFGLPDKVGGSTDVKSITWSANGVVTALNGGTIGAYVGTANHTFVGTAVVAATDIYVVTMRSTFNPEAINVQKL